ncbi:14365_t:CDS:2 [Funneliformis mosseae]|uniref:14365_t:CDS:1 n=1 Tax=Funneliformis mosseae TaxID=27381 RepID=A0A9N9G1B2_FUNMO|nr:14365_t:CDS:2 [Funneliformis mosseae]
MSGQNHSQVPYPYDPNNYVSNTTPSTDPPQTYYGYDYNAYSSNAVHYTSNSTTSGYEGYGDYSTYNASAYYYPSTGGTAATSTATTATVVEAPPSMINTTVSLSSNASINNKSGHNQHQQDRGLSSSFHGPTKDEMMTGTNEQSGMSSSNKQQSSKKKQKTIIRAAGGEVWEDPTLLEWDLNDFRLFCGDLGNEVTDDVLYKAFCKYPSIQKAKVIRDKRTGKSKGYGFVSFKDADEFVKAWKEMNGKYVGNRPIKLRKSTWKERNIDVKTKKHHPYK